jgi:hypothetical protein
LLIVKNPETKRVSLRCLGPITLPHALWYLELAKGWFLLQ